MRTSIWVYEAYPFLYQEMRAIEEAIKRVYGVQATYCKEWIQGHQVDQIILGGGTKSVQTAIANTMRVMHLQQAILNSRYESRIPTLEGLTIVVGEQPDWARAEQREGGENDG